MRVRLNVLFASRKNLKIQHYIHWIWFTHSDISKPVNGKYISDSMNPGYGFSEHTNQQQADITLMAAAFTVA